MQPLPLLPSLPPDIAADPVRFLAQQLDWDDSAANSARELLERDLPPLVTLRTLSFLFGVSTSLFAAMARDSARYYRTFEIPKRQGSRTIHAPRVALKVVQRWIHDHILAGQPLLPEANAFAPDRSIFTNAVRHVGRRNFLALDVADFFPSISTKLVEGVFEAIGFNPLIAVQLTSLCTLEGGLPQGAPTSPMLSNLVFRPVDLQLRDLATGWDAEYSRYADDLAFTSDTHLFDDQDVSRVEDALRTVGLRLNDRKTKRIGGGFRHEVAGLSTTAAGAMPARWRRRQLRAIFHAAEINPQHFTQRSNELMGLAGYVGQYNVYLGERYKAIAATARAMSERS